MVTWNTWRIAGTEKGSNPLKWLHYGEGACLSTDTKPTDGIANGSILTEMDTGNVCTFNYEAKTWLVTWGG